jgi:hypothetical protein
MKTDFRLGVWLALLASASLLPACATTGVSMASKEDLLQLGRDGDGDPCTARFFRNDPTRTTSFDHSWGITCRGAASARNIGFLRSTPSRDTVARIEETLSCGAAVPVQMAGVGTVQARRCLDSGLGGEAVVLTAQRGDRTLVGSAQPGILGPLEDGFRQIAVAVTQGELDRQTQPTVQFAQLPAPPSAGAAAADTAELNPEAVLREGIALNHRGLHSEASRLLNDALSRIGESASPTTRAELYLEAALADSNIRFPQAAAGHFERAQQLLGPGGVNDPVLLRKRDIYMALDLLNQRKFNAALTALDRLLLGGGEAGQPLTDPAVIGALNQQAARDPRDAANVIAGQQDELRRRLLLNAQALWARSVTLRALRRPDDAQAALEQAANAFESVAPMGAQQEILWLRARIERQRGRLAAARKDWLIANRSFDQALSILQESAAANQWTGREPAIADAMLERASVLAAQGAPADQVRKEYAATVQAMIEAKAAGSIASGGIEPYLDLLVEEAAKAPREDTYELYFLALQAIGEPAVARQLNRLQTVVSADPALGARFREREDLERQLTGLRYRIANAPAAEQAALEEQRRAVELNLQKVETELAQNARASSIDESPATIADIRGKLRPGEAYFKVTPLNARAYGLVIDGNGTQIYSSEAPLATLTKLAGDVRDSIDGGIRDGSERIRPFAVAESYALFQLLAGPAAERLLSAKAIVVEPSGPLERLPLGVLVTDRASVERYLPRRRSREAAQVFDYSDLAFLASRAELSTAVSPRSFLVARSREPSAAAQPFIGFAEHSPESAANYPATGQVQVGNACFADASELRRLMAINLPIQRSELAIARSGLGLSQSPEMAGTGFTDRAVQQRTDLAQFQVLHFATHGLEEGVFGCSKSPPALLTSIGETGSDGLLSFDEIAGLQLDANLVVLSACDTASGVKDLSLARASGQEETGSTLEGLVRAFLTANSRAVLATYWQVSAEEETDELVRTFYSTGRNQTIGTALRTAQQRLIGTPEYSHPYYWGPYFLVGDSGKMMLSQPGSAAQQAASR